MNIFSRYSVGTLAMVAAWIALLVVAERSSRIAEWFAGSLVLFVLVGALRALERIREADRAEERDYAAELALSVQPPSWIDESTRRQVAEVQRRIAQAIRGRGAHLRGDHG